MIRRMSRPLQDKPRGVTRHGDRLLLARVAAGWSHEKLSELSGLDRLRIQALESGKTKGLTRVSAEKLAKGFKVDREILEGYLLRSDSLEDFMRACRGEKGRAPIAETHVAFLRRLAERMGIDHAPLVALSETENGEKMLEMSSSLRRAVMGIVYVLGYPMGTALSTAQALLAERGDTGVESEEWFTAIRKRLPPRPPSGEFPSSSEIKAATKIS